MGAVLYERGTVVVTYDVISVGRRAIPAGDIRGVHVVELRPLGWVWNLLGLAAAGYGLGLLTPFGIILGPFRGRIDLALGAAACLGVAAFYFVMFSGRLPPKVYGVVVRAKGVEQRVLSTRNWNEAEDLRQAIVTAAVL